MVDRKRLGRTLVLLAAFVFFSANSIYFLERPGGPLMAAGERTISFDFDHLRDGSKLKLGAKAALLVNYENGEVLYARNADVQRPIASITKLVTAMVVMDRRLDLSTVVTVTQDDVRNSSRSRLRAGYQLTANDLMYAALLNSDNRAARALARAACGSVESFVKEMNLKMKKLGLRNTEFFEPTGLDSRNVSTAHEVAKILHYAYEYELIRKITSEKSHLCRVVNRKNKQIRMANTNMIVNSTYKVLTGKTGYIDASAYCLTTLVQNRGGEKLTCVVLGVPGDRQRFREARKLVDWGFSRI
ncbi:MAG: serine hydrolase [Candidatus Zixiibacteriota bacterium]